MPNAIIDYNVIETTALLAQIIRQKYEETTYGSLKGYLVPDVTHSIISRSERKYFSAFGRETLSPCHGSVKCSETGWRTRSLTAMIIAYSVRNNLMDIFRDYPFKKFEIEIETFPKYRFTEKKFWRYRKTGDDLSFLKANIKW